MSCNAAPDMSTRAVHRHFEGQWPKPKRGHRGGHNLYGFNNMMCYRLVSNKGSDYNGKYT